MRKLVLPAVLLAAIAVVGCSSNNKKNNSSVTPISANLSSSTPIAALTPVGVSGTPVPIGGAPIVATPRAATPLAGTPIASTTTTPAGSPAAASAQPSASAAPSTSPTSAPTQAPATAAAASSAPAASATAAATSAAAPAATSPSGGSSDPLTLIQQINPGAGDLPSGFSLGQFAGEQPNAQAITGYANEQDVLSLFNSSGRQDGFVQQFNGPNGETFGASYGVWADAAGAKQFMDNHPVPDSSVTFKQVQLDQPLGDQYQALQIGSGSSMSYALSWRVGRVVIGLGGAAGPDGKPSADMLQLANLLTQRATAAQQ